MGERIVLTPHPHSGRRFLVRGPVWAAVGPEYLRFHVSSENRVWTVLVIALNNRSASQKFEAAAVSMIVTAEYENADISGKGKI
jgi:hypothetical protein